jgi:mannose-6-phosphate isomerase-like protein (cupin superfamily)
MGRSEVTEKSLPLTMPPRHRFTTAAEAEVEELPGKTHLWHSKPGFTDTQDLLVVRAIIQPGDGHPFHFHANKEEVLYILSGTADQWVEQEVRQLRAGDSVYIPADVIHATFNRGTEPLEFLAVITPASADGPITTEVGEQEPWKTIAATA